MRDAEYWLMVRSKGRRGLTRVVMSGKPLTWKTEPEAKRVADHILDTDRKVAAVHVRRRTASGFAEKIGTPNK